jgi:hypothetical protein
MAKCVNMNQTKQRPLLLVVLGLALWGGLLFTGQRAAAQEPAASVPQKQAPLTPAELEELVSPIALYPDELLSIVLPASTYPIQIVQAARYLERHETDPTLEPDEDWDDSIVALLNYPEVVDLMNADLDWTWELGRGVLYQKSELMDAIQEFRHRAYAAGNLQTDGRQLVTEYEETIIIESADPTVIYVPYYEPERVVVYHSYPVYHYYPRAYPVYYYPYPYGRWFGYGFFWGVTLAFSIDWHSHHVHAYHHHHHGHPYYGHDYHHSSYRRHSLSVSYSENIWRPGYKSGSRQLQIASARPGNQTLDKTSPRKGKYHKQTERPLRAPGLNSAKRSTEATTPVPRREHARSSFRPEPGFKSRREKSPVTSGKGSRKLVRPKATTHRSPSTAIKRARPDSKRTPSSRRYAGVPSTQSSDRRSGRGVVHKKKDRTRVTSSSSVSTQGTSRRASREGHKKKIRSGFTSSESVTARQGGTRLVAREGHKKKTRSGLTSSRDVSNRQGASRRVPRQTGTVKGIAARSSSSPRSGGRSSFQSSVRSSFGSRQGSRAGSPSAGIRQF